MTLRKHLIASLAIALVTLGTASAVQPAAQDGKDPLIGTWALNLAKSTFGYIQAPRSITKTFDYTQDGLILVTYDTVYADGRRTHIHWFIGLDGKEYPEYVRANGKIPQMYLSTKVVDRYTKDVIDRKAPEGSYANAGTYTFRIQVAPDGKTMTMHYRNPEGKINNAVYDRVQ